MLGAVLAGFVCCRSYSETPRETPATSGHAGSSEAGSLSGGSNVGGSAVMPQAGAGDAGDTSAGAGGAHDLQPGAGGAGAGPVGGAAQAGAGGDGPAPPDAPLSVGLQLWLRADLGTTLAGTNIVKWEDQTSNHLDATQAEPASQPLLVAKGLAGKPAVVFDGVDDWLRLPSLELDYAAGFSLFMAMERESQAVECEGFFEASNGTEIDDIQLGWWRSALHFEVWHEWVNDPRYPFENGVPVIVGAIDSALGSAVLRTGGQDVGMGMVTLPTKVKRNEVYLARTLYGGCGYLHGAIGEVLLYNRALSETERGEVEAYLGARWAVSP